MAVWIILDPGIRRATLRLPTRAAMVLVILRRLAIMLGTAVAGLTIVFALVHASGDPTTGFLDPSASESARERARDRLGLDRPVVVQYVTFVGRAAKGDFGESWRSRQPALDTVIDRIPSTLRLAMAALIVAVTGGLSLGMLAARMRFGAGQVVVRFLALIGQAVPAFWLGLLGILLFSVTLDWLPSSGNEGWQALVLPAVTLSAYPGSLIARVTQSALVDVAHQPYITNAHAKGLPERMIWIRHIAPNGVLPAVAIIGLQAGFLVGGTVVVESVFAYPGLGRLAMQASSDRDLPVILAFVVVITLMMSLINLATDLVAVAIDPTLRNPVSGAGHG